MLAKAAYFLCIILIITISVMGVYMWQNHQEIASLKQQFLDFKTQPLMVELPANFASSSAQALPSTMSATPVASESSTNAGQ